MKRSLYNTYQINLKTSCLPNKTIHKICKLNGERFTQRQMLLDILSKTSIKGFSKKRKTQIAQRLMAEKNISQLIMETVYKNRAVNERIDEEDKK